MSDANHIPLLDLCWRALRPRSPRGYELSPTGEDALYAGLLGAKDDPDLPRGVHALFEAACILHDEENSPEAAAAILRALEKARPHLGLRAQAEAAIIQATTGGLDHVDRRAPRLGESAPAGSIKLHLLGNPGRTRP